MSHGAMTSDEDDWETADLSSIKAPGGNTKAGGLRPSAPLFQPRMPSASQAASSARPSAPSLAPNEGNNAPAATAVKLLSRATSQTQTSMTGGPVSGARASVNRVSQRGAAESDGDDWFAQRGKVTNRQLWESANASSAAPPTILAPTAQPMPQPTIQILRRDQAAPGKQTKLSGAPAQSKTMEEREEQYRIARERIFGTTSGSGSEASAPDSGAGPSTQAQSDSIPSSRTSSGKGRKRRPKKDGAGPQLYLSPSTEGYDRGSSPTRAPLGPGPTPHQVRGLAPAATESPRSAPTQGIVRQPRGAEAGVGFGAGRYPSGDVSYGSSGPVVSASATSDPAYDPSKLDDQMAHWMSQASFGSTPRGHKPQPY